MWKIGELGRLSPCRAPLHSGGSYPNHDGSEGRATRADLWGVTQFQQNAVLSDWAFGQEPEEEIHIVTADLRGILLDCPEEVSQLAR